MFNQDFYPTPPDIISEMLSGLDLREKVVLEPSAGSGNIIDAVQKLGAYAIACELEPKLQKIITGKCQFLKPDFLEVQSHEVSHVSYIIMNPPFSADERHINHAWNIAPAGCKIISLCNSNTVQNTYSRTRKELEKLIETYGSFEHLGECFKEAERRTPVSVSLIRLQKPGGGYDTEFEGFFMEEEPESEGVAGIMSYNFATDLVNRYIAAVKIFDQQLSSAVQMNSLLSGFYSSKLAFDCTEDGKPIRRTEFKKDLQKSAWNFIFQKMGMEKFTTQGLKSDINKFVEQQTQVPFTVRNIFKMLEIVIGTHESRMDRALEEVFDSLTMHYHDNRYNVEGWKTNSHYLINRKFIIPYMTSLKYSGGMGLTHGRNIELIEDMVKALCYLTGTNYDYSSGLWAFINNTYIEGGDGFTRKPVRYEWGTWYEWGFFRIKGFKKGTMHFEFKDEDVWAKFNQRIAKLKGYPLYETHRSNAK